MNTPRNIKLKYDARCCSCRHLLKAGRRAWYWPKGKPVLCYPCAERKHGLTAALAHLATIPMPQDLFPGADLGFELRGQVATGDPGLTEAKRERDAQLEFIETEAVPCLL